MTLQYMYSLNEIYVDTLGNWDLEAKTVKLKEITGNSI